MACPCQEKYIFSLHAVGCFISFRKVKSYNSQLYLAIDLKFLPSKQIQILILPNA